MKTDPHRPSDAASLTIAQQMLTKARDSVLATLDAEGWPQTSRIGLQTDAGGVPLVLLSSLALHTAAIERDPRAALLIDGEDRKGSALARPRLSLQVRAERVLPDEVPELRARWREQDPKSAVYLDLPDFRFWRLRIVSGLLNAGFGKAFVFTAEDFAA